MTLWDGPTYSNENTMEYSTLTGREEVASHASHQACRSPITQNIKREEWSAPHNMHFMGPQCELGRLLHPLLGSAYEAFTMSYHVTNVRANWRISVTTYFFFFPSWWLSRCTWPCTITSWLVRVTHSSRFVQMTLVSIFSCLLMTTQQLTDT